MKILAIETSCDETACSVVENGRTVLSSVIHTQLYEHRLYGGVVPEIASRRHIEQIVPVTERALEEAGFSLSEMDSIAVTYAPGLIGALLVGVNFAKGLALATGLPLIPVHHIRGHIAANYIAFPELKPPFLCLVISGGHTQIVEVLDYTGFRVVGRTRDDAAGEAFDKVARALGLPYPGGVAMDKEARHGNAKAYHWTEPKVDGSPYDFSFSGLKTAVLNQIHRTEQRGEPVIIADIAASFERTVVHMLTSRTMDAAKKLGYKKISIAGGVSANTGVREGFAACSAEAGVDLYIPPLALCGDNAAMIGAQAYFERERGYLADFSLNAVSTLSIEQSYKSKILKK